MALHGAETPPQWFHSDQGSEYTSYALTHLLEQHNTQVSHSPQSSPWRNGAQESFFGRFKVEFGTQSVSLSSLSLWKPCTVTSAITIPNGSTPHIESLRSSPDEWHQSTLTRYPQVMSLARTPSRPCGAEEQPIPLECSKKGTLTHPPSGEIAGSPLAGWTPGGALGASLLAPIEISTASLISGGKARSGATETTVRQHSMTIQRHSRRRCIVIAGANSKLPTQPILTS